MRPSVILLVEDNSRDEALTMRALKKSGINDEIIVMRDGADALEFVLGHEAGADDRPGPMPTLVLLDLNLPKIGGLDVLRRLRGDPRTRLLPVVVLTSSDEDKDVVESYHLGANSYVRKPVE
jgi:two-component system, response regulator